MFLRSLVVCLFLFELTSGAFVNAGFKMRVVMRPTCAMVDAPSGDDHSSSPRRRKRRRPRNNQRARLANATEASLRGLDIARLQDADSSTRTVQAGIELLRDALQRNNWRQEEYGPWKEQRLRSRQEMKQHAPGLFESMGLLDSDEIEDCDNEYELVVRAAKELEWLLEHDFGARSSRAGLVGKAKAARTANDEPLPPQLISNIKRIADFRNAFIHRRNVDAIPDLQAFLGDWREVLAELSLERARVKACKTMKVFPRRPGDTHVRCGGLLAFKGLKGTMDM
jgi:hypothetical protein